MGRIGGHKKGNHSEIPVRKLDELDTFQVYFLQVLILCARLRLMCVSDEKLNPFEVALAICEGFFCCLLSIYHIHGIDCIYSI
jgi:hypothetical protein